MELLDSHFLDKTKFFTNMHDTKILYHKKQHQLYTADNAYHQGM